MECYVAVEINKATYLCINMDLSQSILLNRKEIQGNEQCWCSLKFVFTILKVVQMLYFLEAYIKHK